MKSNSIRHIRTLYLLFAGILLLCIGLFLGNVLHTDEEPRVALFPDTNPTYAFRITDLEAASAIYNSEHQVDSTAPGVTAHTHVSLFDVDIFTSDDRIGKDARIGWVMFLQGFGLVSVVAVFVLVVIVLISLYRSAKHGQVFPASNTLLLSVIGILMIATTLALDTSAYLERRVALDLLLGTPWQPDVRFTIHFTRIFFGLTLIFMAQLFRIGRQLQEDQELTI